MDDLIKAIVTMYGSNAAGPIALRTATAGGLWLNEAPQQSNGVYIMMTPVTAPIEYAMSSDSSKPYTEDCDIQFTFSSLFGTAADIITAMNAFTTVYQRCSLSMTSHSLLVAKKINELEPIRDPDTRGMTGYQEYRFTIGG